MSRIFVSLCVVFGLAISPAMAQTGHPAGVPPGNPAAVSPETAQSAPGVPASNQTNNSAEHSSRPWRSEVRPKWRQASWLSAPTATQ